MFILYLLNPYRLNNLFLRAAVGEVLGAIFLPLLALGVYELVCRDYKKWWLTVIALEQLLDDDKKVITGCMLLVSAQLTLTCMDGYMTELKIYLTSRNSMPESTYNSDYYTMGTDLYPMKTSYRKLSLDEEIQISEYTTYWGGLSFNFKNADKAQNKTITLPLYYSGVFQANLDGEELPIIQSSLNHAAALTIPENVNKGVVSIQYSAKNRYRKGDLISAVFILLCGGYYICRAGIRKRKKRINSQQAKLSESNAENS